jgi:phosphate transport system permease protein
MVQSIFGRRRIFEEAKTEYPNAKLSFRWWLNPDFFMRSQSSNALYAGVRSAILGSFITILITILVAFPIGVGAAIYLEEYAKPNPLNRIIQTNIYNLSGVPSIIYGMLGLGIFVRALEPLTSGALFGITSDGSGNGRTILSASLTLALLILRRLIITAQEAIRAFPGACGIGLPLGATRWQVIWHHVLPAPDRNPDRLAWPSPGHRETAPLGCRGLDLPHQDPTRFSRNSRPFPIQIYQWTARPQGIPQHSGGRHLG